jgi:hypothetical protein
LSESSPSGQSASESACFPSFQLTVPDQQSEFVPVLFGFRLLLQCEVIAE